MGRFRGFILSLVFHNNSVMTKLGDEPIFKSKKSPQMEMMVMWVVWTSPPHLVNPLVPFKLSFIMESCAIFMVNLALNMR